MLVDSFTSQNDKQNTINCIFSNAKNKAQKACSIVVSAHNSHKVNKNINIWADSILSAQ